MAVTNHLSAFTKSAGVTTTTPAAWSLADLQALVGALIEAVAPTVEAKSLELIPAPCDGMTGTQWALLNAQQSTSPIIRSGGLVPGKRYRIVELATWRPSHLFKVGAVLTCCDNSEAAEMIACDARQSHGQTYWFVASDRGATYVTAVQLVEDEKERALIERSMGTCKCGRTLDGFDCNGAQCIDDARPSPIIRAAEGVTLEPGEYETDDAIRFKVRQSLQAERSLQSGIWVWYVDDDGISGYVTAVSGYATAVRRVSPAAAPEPTHQRIGLSPGEQFAHRVAASKGHPYRPPAPEPVAAPLIEPGQRKTVTVSELAFRELMHLLNEQTREGETIVSTLERLIRERDELRSKVAKLERCLEIAQKEGERLREIVNQNAKDWTGLRSENTELRATLTATEGQLDEARANARLALAARRDIWFSGYEAGKYDYSTGPEPIEERANPFGRDEFDSNHFNPFAGPCACVGCVENSSLKEQLSARDSEISRLNSAGSESYAAGYGRALDDVSASNTAEPMSWRIYVRDIVDALRTDIPIGPKDTQGLGMNTETTAEACDAAQRPIVVGSTWKSSEANAVVKYVDSAVHFLFRGTMYSYSRELFLEEFDHVSDPAPSEVAQATGSDTKGGRDGE